MQSSVSSVVYGIVEYSAKGCQNVCTFRVKPTGSRDFQLARFALSRRWISRMTRRRADHVSSTAQTLLSTRPRGRANSRTTSSVTVVLTPALFFGHEIQ